MLVKFEQNHVDQITQNSLEDVSETICLMQTINLKTTIFHCTKNYGNPTLAPRLKVVPNMADPISIKDADSRLKAVFGATHAINITHKGQNQRQLVVVGWHIHVFVCANQRQLVVVGWHKQKHECLIFKVNECPSYS